MNNGIGFLSLGDRIDWVGALDPALRVFDVVMETKYGTSYNAYLVRGEKKTALIDCVKDGFLPQQLERIRQLIDPAKIDYLVVQHTEPDHSGSVAQFLEIAPNAQILCSKSASLFLPLIANRTLPITVVKEGDTLDLGGRILRFISAPFLHWPDTMFTYEESSGILFTCDAFGCHFCPENVLESRTDPVFRESRRLYWECIVAPFASYVTKAIAHVQELNLPKLTAIAPSHGPVLDEDPSGAIALYAQWAREEAYTGEKTAFVGYVSCYGYTKRMAETLSEALAGNGYVVETVDLTTLSGEEAGRRMQGAAVVAIGSPTLNADALPPVWNALAHITVPVIRGKKAQALAFGSYGWSGEAVPMIEQRLTGLGYKVTGTFRTRFKPDDAALCEVAALADTLE